MGVRVFIGGQSVVAKSADGQSVAAFPDVCLSPPSPPVGPLPLPYPNTALASDLTNGSVTVKAHGKELAKKDASFFSKSTGDEAATKAQGMGVVTHQTQGKAYFNSWSMTVKVEDLNVPCHTDLMTHNHASFPANTPIWPYLDETASSSDMPCDTQKQTINERCSADGATTTTIHDTDLTDSDSDPDYMDVVEEIEDDPDPDPDDETNTGEDVGDKKVRCANKACRDAMRCSLQPYKSKNNDGGCCQGQTPHHLVEVHCFTMKGGRASKSRISGFGEYEDKVAPCVCCDQSSRYKGDHGSMHAIQNSIEKSYMDNTTLPGNPKKYRVDRSQMGGLKNQWTYGVAKLSGVHAFTNTFTSSCSSFCLMAQLDAYHHQIRVQDSTVL